ncbi:hypothetical protein [Bradyrhizobium sp. AZCC 2289]|uniref:hypothetical protein n=1 Tax=Bradyrhizobium sp. AZCC 2289 TaxID=3117026 RepID=UPI002FEED35D
MTGSLTCASCACGKAVLHSQMISVKTSRINTLVQADDCAKCRSSYTKSRFEGIGTPARKLATRSAPRLLEMPGAGIERKIAA